MVRMMTELVICPQPTLLGLASNLGYLDDITSWTNDPYTNPQQILGIYQTSVDKPTAAFWICCTSVNKFRTATSIHKSTNLSPWTLSHFNEQVHSRCLGSTTLQWTNSQQILGIYHASMDKSTADSLNLPHLNEQKPQQIPRIYHAPMNKTTADPWNLPCFTEQNHSRSLEPTMLQRTTPQQIPGIYHAPMNKATADPWTLPQFTRQIHHRFLDFTIVQQTNPQ